MSHITRVQGGVMGYSLVALSMMILYILALIYREIFSKVITCVCMCVYINTYTCVCMQIFLEGNNLCVYVYMYIYIYFCVYVDLL